MRYSFDTHTHTLSIYLVRIFWSIGEFEVVSEAMEKVQKRSEIFRDEESGGF
jgi:hypothetical protein